jgi:hypothetical protein
MERAAPRVPVAVFFRAPVETQDLAYLRNNPKNRHGTLAFAGASLHSVAFGSISLRSTREGTLKRNLKTLADQKQFFTLGTAHV